MLFDQRNLAADTTTSDIAPTLDFASETSGVIDFYDKQMKILSKSTNLDNFKTTLHLREVEN